MRPILFVGSGSGSRRRWLRCVRHTSLLSECFLPQHVVQADEKGHGPAPQRPARKHTPPHSVQQVIDRYESQARTGIGLAASHCRPPLRAVAQRRRIVRQHAASARNGWVQLQEQEEVPVKDFAEGHNWSHEDETNFIFGRQKHHGYNYNRHQPGRLAHTFSSRSRTVAHSRTSLLVPHRLLEVLVRSFLGFRWHSHWILVRWVTGVRRGRPRP